MNNRDFLVRLKKTDRDGGDYLSWVVWPSSNTQNLPSVVESYDGNKSYPAGIFINYEGALYKSNSNVPVGSWDAAKWDSAEGYEAYITPHSTNLDYPADSVIYDANGDLWYLEDAAAKGLFEDQAWVKLTPEEKIETAVAYLDPNSQVEAPRVIRGSFVDVEKTAVDLLGIALAYYDASDKYTLFQDVSGSVPVTTPGQYVRYISDQIGENDVVINAAIPPVYREDANGRGFLENADGTNFSIQSAGETTAAQVYQAIPNVGVLRSAAGNLDAGFDAKPSEQANVPFTQAVIVDAAASAEDQDKVIMELRRFSNRYDNGVLTSLSYFFREQTAGYTFVGEVNLRNVFTLRGMFFASEVIEDLTTWDVSKVEDFSEMFCESTGTIDLSGWNTASAKYMDSMFENNTVFDSPISTLNVSSVISARRMFAGATVFNQDITAQEWTALNYADEMLANTTVYDTTVTGFTAPALVAANGFLRNAIAYNQVTTLSLPSLTTAQNFFEGATLMSSDITINAIDLVNISAFLRDVTDFSARVQFSSTAITVADEAFKGCSRFNAALNINMENIVSAISMMEGCASFNQPLEISPANILTASRMFHGCTSLVTQPFTSLFFEAATDIDFLFYDCGALTADLSDIQAPFAESLESMFENCIGVTGQVTVNARNATTALNMFKGCSAFNGRVDMTLYRATTIESIFEECLMLNDDVTINAPRLTSVKAAFRGCDVMTGNIMITTALVTDWSSFLENALVWNAPLLLDMTSITTAGAMFKGAVAFNADISNIPLNDITDLTEFLSGATAFDQDLSTLCVEKHPVMPADFVSEDMPFFTDTAKHPQWGIACA
ncbi:hypothetical protein SM033_00088 [Vibrio phage vB_VpaM_sm033]|nr:hypothetical protein SM033_00088 [Vibrio phage vB_VpaM_sm033]